MDQASRKCMFLWLFYSTGFIYYQPERDLVKISHISFFGNRTSMTIPMSEIKHLSETTSEGYKGVFNVEFYDPDLRNLIVFTKFGGIRNEKYFTHIFGNEALP